MLAMSNFGFNITARKAEPLLLAMQIAFLDWKEATHYYVTPEAGFVFCWHESAYQKQALKLPIKLDAKGAADMGWRWLCEQDYGRPPDIDGDCTKDGWRVYNDVNFGEYSWDSYAICGIIPVWSEHHK